MSTTLSYGFKKPQDGDTTWWDDLEFDITRLNSHNHDGTNSAQLSPYNLNKNSTAIANASWAAVSGQAGTYKQTVTVPSGYAVNTMQTKFYITNGSETGHEVNLSVRKVTSTTYDVFINDNSVDLMAVYG